MKKILIAFITLILLSACGMSVGPSIKVSEYLNNYNSLSEDVVQDMESVILNENLTTENIALYRDVLKRQYQNLKYDIVEEAITGDNAVVMVKITVYDLYNSKIQSEIYANENQNQFLNEENIFDEVMYNSYRLNQMLQVTDTVTYDISFNLTKKDNEWVISKIDRETLEKIHGFYNSNLG